MVAVIVNVRGNRCDFCPHQMSSVAAAAAVQSQCVTAATRVCGASDAIFQYVFATYVHAERSRSNSNIDVTLLANVVQAAAYTYVCV